MDAVPTCKQAGVMEAVVGAIGTLQAMESIKYLLGVGELLTGCFLTYDALDMEFQKIQLRERVPECPVCGAQPTITRLID